MENKKNVTIILIVIIIIAIIAIVVVKNQKEILPAAPINPTNQAIDQAVKSDTTKSITDSIDSIKVDDTTSTDLNTVDQELNKL